MPPKAEREPPKKLTRDERKKLEKEAYLQRKNDSKASSTPDQVDYFKEDLPEIHKLDEAFSHMLYHSLGQLIPRPVLVAFELSGHGILWLSILIGLAYFDLTPRPLRRAAIVALLGFSADLAVIGSIKAVFQRPRPKYAVNTDYLALVSVDNYSFPSGHASRAAQLATLAVALVAFESHLAPVLSMELAAGIVVWASLTCFSRVLLGRHYFTDVMFGSIIGMFLGVVFSILLFLTPTFSRDPLSQGWVALREFLTDISERFAQEHLAVSSRFGGLLGGGK